jgi:hypothetical protein
MFTQEPIDLIIFAIGSLPSGLQFSLHEPVKMEQPTVCADSVNTIIQALTQLDAADALQKKPFFVAISTTGVKGALGKENREDVPLLMAPLYHWVLTAPHKDKQNMETAVSEEGDRTVGSVLSGWSIVRPTLLTDAAEKGAQKIRFGWQDKKQSGPGPAKGYFVGRGDVGGFIFGNLIKGKFGEWNGRVITLTN